MRDVLRATLLGKTINSSKVFFAFYVTVEPGCWVLEEQRNKKAFMGIRGGKEEEEASFVCRID